MRRLIALSVLGGVIILLLVLAQVILPGIAAQQLRDRLSHSGKVVSVQVSAFPAIELLWHRADHVVIRMATYHSNPGHLSGLLDESSDAGSLDASTRELDTGLVTLRDASLHKRGQQLTGTAAVTQADLRSALGGAVQGLQPVASGDGQLTLQGTVLGVTAQATLRAQDGKLVIQPDVPLLNLVTLTVFSDPHIDVQAVGAAAAQDRFALSAQARLR